MRILLSSVFGPYGVDDAYGRKENLMELFHNQVTRGQGLFSLRFNHHSFGLYLIAENLHARTAVLDFPTEARFIREIKKGYDYVGISFIVPNFIKARRMAELIRRHAPRSRIVLGGHGTRIPGLEDLIEHDHICPGEGVRWFRELLGEDPDRPLRHPSLPSSQTKRILGLPMRTSAAVLLPGVGCPNHCRFCATSHFFDRRYIPFFDSGDALYACCEQIERDTGLTEFFVMDENFLKRPARARRLLELMDQHEKSYRFGIFSSAEAIAELGVEFLTRLGVYFLWIGVESRQEVYAKNRGLDLKAIIRDLRDHGIGVLASGILFLEQHDPQTVWEDIRHLVDMESDFVQFMQLGPLPGTTLFQDYDRQGRLRWDIPYEEWHGQHRLWFDHPHFSGPESERILRAAFAHDYDTQGSSLLRLCQTAWRGYRRLARYDDVRMRRRRSELLQIMRDYRPALPALLKYAHNDRVRALTEDLIRAYERELGPATFWQHLAARVTLFGARREASRVRTGRALRQPRTEIKRYRPSARALVAAHLKGKSLANLLKLAVHREAGPIRVDLGGTLDRVNAKALARQLRATLQREARDLTLCLDRLATIEDEALRRLLVRVRKHHRRILVLYDERVEAVRRAIARLPTRIATRLNIAMSPRPATPGSP